MRFVLALLLIVCSAPQTLRAQQLSPELQKRLQRLQAKPQASWTESDFDEMGQLIVAASGEVLRTAMTPAQRARIASVPIRVVEDDSGRNAWTAEDTIFVSADSLGELLALGFHLGRDSWILAGNELPLPRSLLLTPFARSQLLPLIPSLHERVLNATPWQLLRCPANEPECVQPQEAACIAGTIGFAIAHEMAHVILGHKQQNDQPLADELAADRLAWTILEQFAPQAADAEEDELLARFRAVILAGPFVVLRWLRDNPHGRDADARIEALRRVAGDEYFLDISMLAEPAWAPASRFVPVRLSWTEEPAELYIDGTRVDPRDVAGKTLTLLVHAKVFARRDDRFAFLEVTDESASAALTFTAPPPGIASQEERRRLRRERQWFALFLRTTSSNMTPATPSVTNDFRAAFAQLGMGRTPLRTWR